MAMWEEELYESEVLWPEPPQAVPASAPGVGGGASTAAPTLAVHEGRPPCAASTRPVDIPRAAARSAAAAARWSADLQDDVVGGGGAMVPPHVMVSRRRSAGEPGAAAFSLRSGTGGARRDLSHLRNSVLRMTGFIEG